MTLEPDLPVSLSERELRTALGPNPMPADPRADVDPTACDGEAMLLAVYRAAERVTAELDLSCALEEIIACVRDPLGLDRAGVFLYRRRRGDLILLIGVG